MSQNPDTTQSLVLEVPSTVKVLVEAMIFAAEEPLTPQQVKAVYEDSAPGSKRRTIDATQVESIVKELNDEYKTHDRPYRIIGIAGGFQFATLSEYAGWIGRLQREQLRRKLSQSAVETLAMIAYKQPISKPEIESIRGVNCDYVLKTLLEKDLITVTGRAPTVGRPLLYGTTRQFLMHFGLRDVTDLPRPREIEEILGESQFETERRMLEAQAAAREAEKEKLKEDLESRLPHIPRKQAAMDESVEIVPKRRTKSLVPPPAEKAHKEADQTKQADADLPSSSQKKPTTVPLEIPEEKVSGQPPEEQTSSSDARDTGPVSRMPARPEEPVAGIRGEESQGGVGVHQPSRWQRWKDTIQTILKKLFG